MQISTNLAANNTYNKLKNKNKKVQDSHKKLTSGSRINQAADDAAGMTITEKLKSQIRGAKQANRNIQDGNSLAQTAEGGLNEIQDILQRIRELTVKAASDTLTTKDRKEIQKEVNQMKEEVNSIANNTEFNNKKLLTPKIKEVTDPPQNTEKPKVDIVFHIDYSGSMTHATTGSSAIEKVNDGIGGFIDKLSQSLDGQVAVVDITSDPANPSYSDFSSETGTIKNNINSTGDPKSGTRPYESLEKFHPNGDLGKNLNYRSDSKKVFVLFTDADKESSNTLYNENTAKNQLEGTDIKDGYDQDDIQTYVFGMSGNDIEENDFDDIVSSTGGKNYMGLNSAEDIENALQNDLIGEINNNIGNDENSDANQPGILKLQVGPNSQDTFEIKLTDARAKALGIDDLEMDPIEKAMEALKKVDQALNKVSSERGKFGSYQNRLNHISNNVSNYEENVNAAKSHIEDVDMAKEYAKLTKSQILSQAAQSMLAQANTINDSILSLIE